MLIIWYAMIKMNSLFRPILAGFAVVLMNCGPVVAQALLPERIWTNADGKKIRAELLDFDSKSADGSVRLRMKGGNIFKVQPGSLSREDQAVILKARFENSFRSRYSESMAAHFFYSNQVDRKADDKVVAYIGNDHESSWLRLKIGAHREILEGGETVIIMAGDASPLRLKYDPDDIDEGRSNYILDTSLTKSADALPPIFANYQKARVLIESKSGTYTEIKLSSPEKLGLKEVSDAYKTLSNLTTDHVWWTTFQGINADEFKKLSDQKAMEETAEQAAPEQMEDSGPILGAQEWTDERSGESFYAEVAGFERHLVNFKLEGEQFRSLPVADLNEAGRDLLAQARIVQSLYNSWHPYDDDYLWLWPKEWTDPADRIEKQVFLVAVNNETAEPALFLQSRYDTDSAVDIATCKLISPKVYLDIDIPESAPSLKLRGRTSSKVWHLLNGEIADLLLVAAPGIESFEFEITPVDGEPQTAEFTAEEFDASLEALEIYRTLKSLYKKG